MIDPISRRLHQNAGRHGPVMLMYHAVSPPGRKHAWPWSIGLRDFVAHLDFLAGEGWTTMTQDELILQGVSAPPRTVVITFDDGYADNLAACEQLVRRGMRATWFIVSGSVGRAPAWPDEGRPAGRLLGADDLRAFQSAGMEIGSHTVNHVRLTEVDDARIEDEMRRSKAELEDLLGATVASLAYPYGAFDARCIDAARRAGYRSACTTRTGWALHDKSAFELRRLTVFNLDTPARLARKLSLGSNDVSWSTLLRYGGARMRSRVGL